MQTQDLYQEIVFSATPQQVYNCYVNENAHADFTGGEAEIEAFAGGIFSAYDGYISGIFKNLEPYNLIVQSWRAEEDEWPEDHFSEVSLLLEEHPKGCLLKFTQTGIPAAHFDSIAQGWQDYYWQPMKTYLLNS